LLNQILPFGSEPWDHENRALVQMVLHARAEFAPWAVIKWLPAGPALSKSAALTQHDTLMPDQNAAAIQTPKAGA